MKKLLNGNKNAVVSIKSKKNRKIFTLSHLELTFQLVIGGGTIINSSDDSKFLLELICIFFLLNH